MMQADKILDIGPGGIEGNPFITRFKTLKPFRCS